MPRSIIPWSAGVSPPPHTAPAARQPSANPLTSSPERCSSANQPESPTAACIATAIGRAPHVTRSFAIVATVSIPMAL